MHASETHSFFLTPQNASALTRSWIIKTDRNVIVFDPDHGTVLIVVMCPLANARSSDTADSLSASASFWTLDQKIFEKERSLTAKQRAATGYAGYFAICGRSLRCFNLDDLILRSAVWALKLC